MALVHERSVLISKRFAGSLRSHSVHRREVRGDANADLHRAFEILGDDVLQVPVGSS
jgi:hypothetical protein